MSLRRPSVGDMERVLAALGGGPLSYAEVGMTRRSPGPPGFVRTEGEGRLGDGRGVFERAATALRQWRMIPAGWIRIVPEEPSFEEATTVCISTSQLGLHTLNLDRVVYTVDEARVCAMAYGTLRDHAETGEEVFEVTHREDDSVWFRIMSYSRPRHVLAWLGYPVTRYYQRRFVAESIETMKRRVAGPGTGDA